MSIQSKPIHIESNQSNTSTNPSQIYSKFDPGIHDEILHEFSKEYHEVLQDSPKKLFKNIRKKKIKNIHPAISEGTLQDLSKEFSNTPRRNFPTHLEWFYQKLPNEFTRNSRKNAQDNLPEFSNEHSWCSQRNSLKILKKILRNFRKNCFNSTKNSRQKFCRNCLDFPEQFSQTLRNNL